MIDVPLTFNAGFTTRSDVKSQLGIRDDDTVDDAIIDDIVSQTAVVIEREAKRSLLRRHSIAEYFSGGSRLLYLRNYPVVAVHSVRESDNRDFENSDNYTELVEGTDYIVESKSNGKAPGILRRLGTNWLGSEDSPGKTRVVYTGGFKTDDEVALENTVQSIGADESMTFLIGYESDLESEVLKAYPTDDQDSSTEVNAWLNPGSSYGRYLAVFLFPTNGVLLPTWGLYNAMFTFYAKKVLPVSANATMTPYIVSPNNPFASDFETVAASILNSDQALDEITISETDYSSATYIYSLTIAELDFIEASVKNGFIALAFDATDSHSIKIASEHHDAVANYRPNLSISHRPIVSDSIVVPPDLRRANILQAVYEYQNRRSPGATSQTMRGVQIATGASLQKPQMDLLPEVVRIAHSYKPLY